MEDDEEYFGSLMEKASSGDVVEYTWYECVEGFKQADRDMGSAFHRKLEWMNRAEPVYVAQNKKKAGFVKAFADDVGISYDYARQLNSSRNAGCNPQNFSSDALKILLSLPKELQEDILSSEEPVKVKEVKAAKEGYKKVKDEGNEDLLEAVSSGLMKPREAAKKALSRAEEAKLEFNSLSEEEKIERLGGAKKVDAAHQRKLDETLDEDFNPYNAATSVLISLNRLRIFGGKKEIEKHIMSELDRSARMQKYEAEALILLAQIVSENYDEIVSYTETKPKLKLVN